jgi:WD40 repeat protein
MDMIVTSKYLFSVLKLIDRFALIICLLLLCLPAAATQNRQAISYPYTTAVDWSSDGSLLLLGTWEQGLTVIDAQTIAVNFVIPYEKTEQIWAAEFSPDNAMIATSGSSLTTDIWDSKTGEKIQALDHGTVGDIAWSPDGSLFATGGAGYPDTIRVWDTTNWEILFTISGGGDEYPKIDWSSDNKLAITWFARIEIWDGATGKEMHRIERLGYRTALEWSRDGESLLVTDTTLTPETITTELQVWNAADGKVQQTFTGFTHWISSAEWNTGGTRILVTLFFNGTVALLDAENGEQTVLLKSSQPVRDAAWNPDSTSIAVGIAPDSIEEATGISSQIADIGLVVFDVTER